MDVVTYIIPKDWFVRFKAFQPAEDRNQIQQAFDNGYKAGYGDMDPIRLSRMYGAR